MAGLVNRWFHPAELYVPHAGHHKKVAWLELFYDLIYVATIIQLGNALSEYVGIGRFLAFAALMTPLWLTWTNFTFYSNRFEVDDFLHRALVFAQMFAIASMAVSVPAVLQEVPEPRAFVLSYVCARLVLVVLYARAWIQVPRARELTRRYGIGFAIGVFLWFTSAWLPAPWSYLLWAVAVLVDLSTPFSRSSREMWMRLPPDVPHFAERYGLLTIIVLGESFVKVLSDVAVLGVSTDIAVLAPCGLLITCCLWWVYFDDVAGSRIKSERLSPFFWILLHLPLTIGITASGVAIKKLVVHDKGLLEPIADKYRWLLCGTLALVFLTVSLIDKVSERRQSDVDDRYRGRLKLAAATLMPVMAFAGGFLPAWLFAVAVTVLCIGQVLADLAFAPLAADPHAVEHEQLSFANPSYDADDVDDAEQEKAPIRRDVREAVRKGAPNELRKDLYFHFMEGSWLGLMVTMLALFVLGNGVFAALYLIDPGGVSGMAPGSFLEAFSFSVQTMSTIGYGAMSPDSTFAHVVTMVEGVVGLLALAGATGLMFAKASQPRSSVLFSAVAVITVRDGQPTLVFRLGNARGNDVVDAKLSVTVLIDEESAEGHRMRRLHDLKLTRSRTPVFALSWSAMHIIDEESPLHSFSAGSAHEGMVAIFVTMTGHDATYAQTTHARHVYYPEHLRFGHRFVDVISTLDDGRLMVDYDHFHDTVVDSDAVSTG